MIIEFFGPAAAGKTTFAHALCKRLNERGSPLSLSKRSPNLSPPSITTGFTRNRLAMR